MDTVRWIISAAPEIFLLLAVAVGTVLGRVKIRGFSIGTTACTLIVAVLIGQLGNFTFPPVVRAILFSLFVFTIGYWSGPVLCLLKRTDPGAGGHGAHARLHRSHHRSRFRFHIFAPKLMRIDLKKEAIGIEIDARA